MWDDAQSLRQLANALIGFSLLVVLFGVLHYTVHLPAFTLKAVRLGMSPQRVDVAQVEQVMRTQLHGNFFTVDLDSARKAFEQLPWVRKVSVHRRFPWQLEVDLEEHVTLADWNDHEFVNTHGEVFSADCLRTAPDARTTEKSPLPACTDAGRTLPRFFGQPDTSAEVTQMYREFNTQLTPLKQQVAQITLSPRRAWQLRLDNGMVLELGRERARERLQRFVAVFPYSLASLQRPVDYVDLRYRSGFAAHLRHARRG